MKKTFLFIFFLAVLGHIIVSGLSASLLQFFFKPFIIPALLGYVILSLKTRNTPTNLLIAALAFSWMGDSLLMFERYNSLFFIFGLVAFLCAHILFIICFGKLAARDKIRLRISLLLICLVYYNVLIFVLYPHLGALKIPVMVYGFVICLMLAIALHLLFIQNKSAGKLIALGAVFFVCSDTCLAFNKFYHAFEFAGIAIMVTYALAQLFIAKGVIEYITDRKIIN